MVVYLCLCGNSERLKLSGLGPCDRQSNVLPLPRPCAAPLVHTGHDVPLIIPLKVKLRHRAEVSQNILSKNIKSHPLEQGWHTYGPPPKTGLQQSPIRPSGINLQSVKITLKILTINDVKIILTQFDSKWMK